MRQRTESESAAVGRTLNKIVEVEIRPAQGDMACRRRGTRRCLAQLDGAIGVERACGCVDVEGVDQGRVPSRMNAGQPDTAQLRVADIAAADRKRESRRGERASRVDRGIEVTGEAACSDGRETRGPLQIDGRARVH